MNIMETSLQLSERSAQFLKEAERRAKAVKSSPRQANWRKAFHELYKEEPQMRRLALAFAYMLKNEGVKIFPEERICGMLYMAVEGAGPCEFDNARYLERLNLEAPEALELGGTGWTCGPGCAPGHIGWHWDWILDYGIEGLLERVRKAYSGADAKGRECLEGMEICLQAVIDWSGMHVEAMKEAMSNAHGEEKARLAEMIETCSRVPRKGARTFKEALQSFHLSYLASIYECPHGGNGPGRLDYHLWPFLKRDIEEGRINYAEARELVDELFIRFHERMAWRADGHVETIVVAGSHPDGSSAANPLSRMMVESICALKGLTHPSIYIRIPADAPEWLTELSAEYLLRGANRAQILNDSAIVKAATADGHIKLEHARDYMCGGCMEVSPFAKNGDALFTGFFNVPKVLEHTLTGGECLIDGTKPFKQMGPLTEYASFEELYSAFEKELHRRLNATFRKMDIFTEEMARTRPAFLVSSQVEDCIGRRRLINDGGALYEDYGSTPLGMPNVADSLTALKIAVFEERFVDAGTMLKALKSDFEGMEPLRLRLRKLPKFGQGLKEADAMMSRVVRSVCSCYEAFTNRLGGKVKPMIMTFMMAAPTGAALGASPDGRHARMPIAQGITPQSSSMGKGIGTAMLSAVSVGLDSFSGGASHIWDIDPCLANTETVKTLLEVFFKAGGQMFQGNTDDVKTLADARRRPEDHGHVTVRVGGFSSVFVSLPKDQQDELMERIRHKA